MADEGDVLTDLDNAANAAANGADNRPVVGFISQYIKDMSVENPNAPDCYQWRDQPQVDIQFNIGATKVNDEIHEVELKINAAAKGEQGNFYLIELSYCGLIGVRNLPEDQEHAFLYAEAPRILFPFARAVIANATRDAGFPQLMLEPMDFGALYQQQLAAKAQQQAAETAASPAGNA